MASVQRRSGSAGLDGEGDAATCLGGGACTSFMPSTPSSAMSRRARNSIRFARPSARYAAGFTRRPVCRSKYARVPPDRRLADGRFSGTATRRLGAASDRRREGRAADFIHDAGTVHAGRNNTGDPRNAVPPHPGNVRYRHGQHTASPLRGIVCPARASAACTLALDIRAD